MLTAAESADDPFSAKRRAQGNHQSQDEAVQNETASLGTFWRRPQCGHRHLGMGYFSVSTTYRRTSLYDLARWGSRSVQAFDL
jgi:hypothetical protein